VVVVLVRLRPAALNAPPRRVDHVVMSSRSTTAAATTRLGVPVPQRPARRLAVALALLAVTSGSGAFAAHRIVAAHDPASSLDVHGTLRLSDPETERNHCVGTDGFVDIGPATHVLLFEDGRIVGVTTLGFAQTDRAAGSCTWRWTVDDVPDGNGVYSVQVSNRGWITFTRDQLAQGLATLTLERPAEPD
jgi:hypothetical protein